MRSRSKNEDRLSSLPEDVLSHILSLMPTKYIVRTCFLSKRWRYTWTLVTNLDFDDVDQPRYGLYSSNRLSKFVDRVLERRKIAKLNLFRLRRDHYMSCQNLNVIKWINDAVRLNVCVLDIEISPTELPISLFTCKTLTKLRLVFNYDYPYGFGVSGPIMLPCLKTLELCVNSTPFVDVFKFINGCPVLESLSLAIKWPDNEKYYNFNIPTLKRLELRATFFKKVVLNVPNLEYLFVGGQSCPHFVMEDLSSLVQAIVVFSNITDRHENLELLNGLSGVKSLSWSFSQVNHFSHSPLPKFLNLKHLELKGPSVDQWMIVIQILESSPELEHLSFQEPQESSWIEPQSVPTCMLSNLKTIKITECKWRKCDLRFLEFMLGNAKVLKTLTITCGTVLDMNEEIELYVSLLVFPRASMFCEIHFLGNWLNFIGN